MKYENRDLYYVTMLNSFKDLVMNQYLSFANIVEAISFIKPIFMEKVEISKNEELSLWEFRLEEFVMNYYFEFIYKDIYSVD